MNSVTTILNTALLCAFLAMTVLSLPKSASAQATVSETIRSESPFACNRMALTPAQRKRHLDELGPKLRSLKRSVRELPNGYEFEFPSDANTFQLVAEWVVGERDCCPFFDIEMRLQREGGALWLGLTGREGVKQFIQADSAAWIKN